MAEIVVLEDDDIIRMLIVRILEYMGHTVHPFPDGAPALRGIDFTSVDLLITDLSMPTSGETVIESLRDSGVTTPVIVVSGNVAPDQARHLETLAVHAILQKPFQVSELMNCVSEIIRE